MTRNLGTAVRASLRVALVLAVLLPIGYVLRRPGHATPAKSTPVEPTVPAAAMAAQAAEPTVHYPAPRLIEHLRALGQRTLDELARTAPALVRTEGDIPALGPCTRPSADERVRIARAIAAADHHARAAELTFGCKDPNGIVVDVVYDVVARGNRRSGVWRVVRASSTAATAHVTTLATYTGTSRDDFMEWANEVTIFTSVLVDLDDDGDRDAVIAQTTHEGGAVSSDTALSLWLSRTAKITTLGSMSDSVEVTRGQPNAPGSPLVLRSDPAHAESGPAHYRCIEPTGAFDICSAITDARRVDRMIEIAGGFVAGATYGPYQLEVPDRELLATLLAELGVTPADHAALLAMAAPALPEVRVARELETLLAPPIARHFGEPDPRQPPDPRPAELMAILGDAPSTPATAAQATVARTRITSWIAANARRMLVDHGDCKAAAKCRWSRPSKPELVASSVAGPRGYYSVRWTYVDNGELLAHDAVFYIAGNTLTLVADAIAIGSEVECAACGHSPPGPQLQLKLYQRDDSLIAVVLGDAATPRPRSFTVAVDGVSTALPAMLDASWYRFGESFGTLTAEADDLVQIMSKNFDAVAYWRWDAGWQRVAAFPLPTVSTTPPTLDPIGTWLWHRQQRVVAHDLVAAFDVVSFASKSDYRAQIQQALVVVGADPALLARVSAAGMELR